MNTSTQQATTPSPVLVVIFWLYVGVPLVWGISSTLQKAMALFQ